MLNVAIDAAKQAGELALKYYKTQPKVNYKADKSPVTKADLEAEKLIRGIINRKFPDHGIIGEEFGEEKPNAKYKWVIDPIDGTKDFIRQTNLWMTLIAVLENNKPIIGVTYYPTKKEIFSAQKGKGTFFNNKKTYVSKVSNIKDSYISADTIRHFKNQKKIDSLLYIFDQVSTQRGLGSYSLSLLLRGKIDMYISAHGGIWDYATPTILVEEAGGESSDLDGNKSLDSNNIILTNGLLHDQVIKLLKK